MSYARRMSPPALAPDEMEELYAGPLGEAPVGVTVGRFIGFLDTVGGREPRNRAVHTLLFRWPPCGVDFERRRWWLVRPRLLVARFTVTAGPSRWRDAEVLRLEYGASRSAFVRRTLYRVGPARGASVHVDLLRAQKRSLRVRRVQAIGLDEASHAGGGLLVGS